MFASSRGHCFDRAFPKGRLTARLPPPRRNPRFAFASLQFAGRPKDAARALEEAVRLYDTKRNIVSAAKARTLLQAVRRDDT